MTELLFERGYSRKVYDLGNGQRRLRAHAGHIHFKDEQAGGAFADIDHTWVDRGTYWEMTRASYRMQVAKDFAAPALIRYRNRYEGADHAITYEPHSLVWATGRDLADVRPFRAQQAVQGVVTGPTIRWTDAFGPGLHFELSLRGSGFTKEIVIQRRSSLEQPPTAAHRLVLLSRYDGPGLDIRDSGGRAWQKAGEFDDAADDGFRVEEPTGKHSLIRPAYIVESDKNETRHRCPVVWTQRAGSMWQAKVLPTNVLVNGTYPLRADTVTSYYAGAGDGFAEAFNHASWALAHAAAGDAADATSTTCRVSSGEFVSGWNIRRAFFPIDVSIPSGSTINSASFHAKTSLKGDNDDNDGDDFWTLVGPTSQASNTTLAAGDYDACGAVTSPQEITADRKDYSSIAAVGIYNDWTLDATGLSIIPIGGGYMLIGMREGHDVLNSAITGGVNADNQCRFYTSEQAGTSDDPYMIVDYTPAGSSSVSPSVSPSASVSPSSSVSPSVSPSASLSPSASTSPSSSQSPSSSPSPSVAPQDAVCWGEQTPDPGEEAVTWQRWQTAPGTPVGVTGDQDWGAAQVAVTVLSPVTDTGDTFSKTFTVQVDKYGTGSGAVTVSIRGSATVFGMHDDEISGPTWAAYSTPTAQSWRYVQLKMEPA